MLGPLGIRVNQWTSINGEIAMQSPYRHGFSWNERVVWARCSGRCSKLCETYPESVFMEVPEAIDIGEEHSCGIYAGRKIEVARSYRNNSDSAVYCLVEGLGTVWMHDNGFRASGVQVVKVINTDGYKVLEPGSLPWLTMYATAKSYDVGVLTLQETYACIELLFPQYLEQIEEERKRNEAENIDNTTNG